MASQQDVTREEEAPADRERRADQNYRGSAPAEEEIVGQNKGGQQEEARAAAESYNNQKQAETPPYPSQQQPLQEQQPRMASQQNVTPEEEAPADRGSAPPEEEIIGHNNNEQQEEARAPVESDSHQKQADRELADQNYRGTASPEEETIGHNNQGQQQEGAREPAESNNNQAEQEEAKAPAESDNNQKQADRELADQNYRGTASPEEETIGHNNQGPKEGAGEPAESNNNQAEQEEATAPAESDNNQKQADRKLADQNYRGTALPEDETIGHNEQGQQAEAGAGAPAESNNNQAEQEEATAPAESDNNQKQADREVADQNYRGSALPEDETIVHNEQGQQAEAGAGAPAESANNQKQAETPPYAYQQEPVHEQQSTLDPKFNEDESNPQQQQVQREQLWGSGQMGAPSNPSAHPDNKEAASGNLTAEEDPYVQQQEKDTTPHPSSSKGKFSFADVTEFSKKVEILVGHLWGHLTTGSSVSDTAIGRLNAGTRLVTHRGFEGFFAASFPSDPVEKLKKTYACFLSTATGPVPGTLFISNKRLAFCSDRPLSYTPPPTAPATQTDTANNDDIPANKGDPAAAADTQVDTANGKTSANGDTPAKDDAAAKSDTASKAADAAATGDAAKEEESNHRYSYYKVSIPIEKIKQVEPSVNPKKASEKYIELITEDNYEFWFMGFVNYDKGVKNLQAALGSPSSKES